MDFFSKLFWEELSASRIDHMALLRWLQLTGGSLRLDFAGATHPGKARGHNEDAYGIDPALRCAVVADGMGGLAHGEIASRIVVESVLTAVKRGQALEAGLQSAHTRIRDLAGASKGREMGATAVAMRVDGAQALIAWMGDSRAYLWRNGQLRQLTKDHSLVQDLIDAGAINAVDALHHPNRNVITRAVGLVDAADRPPAQARLRLQAGDVLLLCTDGLHGYLPEEKIVEECGNPGETDLARRLVNRTLAETDAGDNVTVTVMQASA